MIALEERTVLITGAASGIGRAIAELAAERSARLLLVDLRAEPLTRLSDRLGGFARVMDVGDESAWNELARSTGPWNHVFLNAGVMSARPDAPLAAAHFASLPVERYRSVISVNVDGVFFGLRAAVPCMEKAGGSIVVTASAAGLLPYPYDPVYALSKHAVIGLVRSVAAGRGPPKD